MGSEFPKSKVRWKQTLYQLYVYCILCTVYIHIHIINSFRSLSGCQVDSKGCRFILSLISIGSHFKGLVHIYIYNIFIFIYTYLYTHILIHTVSCVFQYLCEYPGWNHPSKSSEGSFRQNICVCAMTSSRTQVQFLSFIWRMSIHNMWCFYVGQWTKHHVCPDSLKHHLCTS